MRLIEKLIELELTCSMVGMPTVVMRLETEEDTGTIQGCKALPLPIREASSEYQLMDILEKDAIETIRKFPYVKPCESVYHAIAELYKCKFYGPYIVLCDNGDRVTEYNRIEGVESTIVSNVLTKNETYVIQVTPDVLRLVIGESPHSYDGKMRGCLALQLRADFYNNCGIAKIERGL